MSVWRGIIKLLNEKEKVERTKFYRKFCSDFSGQEKERVLQQTVETYLYLLLDCGFIEFFYDSVKDYDLFETYIRLVHEIPEKLTIKEAVEIKQKPWLMWFKDY